MAENKLIVQEVKSSTVPILQRCICCMSRGDFSLKIAHNVCSTTETHKKFYCESCILRLAKNNYIEKGMRKYWEDIAKKNDVNVNPMKATSQLLYEVEVRRGQVLDVIRDFPGKDINEIAEIYNHKYSLPIKSYLLRSDLVFLHNKSFVEKHKKKLYKYYPVAIIKSP